ncbi:MAG TPA: PAS domain S-box protein [Anaerolineales bacterium]
MLKTETYIRRLIARLPVLFFELDPTGITLDVNEAITGIAGYQPEELIGQNWWDTFLPPELRFQVDDLNRRLQSGDISSSELSLKAKNGSIVTLNLDIANEYGPDGALEKVVGLGMDISDRKRAQEQISRSEKQMAQFQQIAHLGSWAWDIPSNVVTWSEELRRIYGLSSQDADLTLESYLERVPPEDRPKIKETIDAAIRTSKSFALEHRIVRPDGSIRTILTRGEVILDADEHPIRVLGTGQDITELRQAEQALRESEARLRAVVTGAPLILWAADCQGIITFSEGKGLALLGLAPGEAVGHSVFEYMQESSLMGENLRLALSGQEVVADVTSGDLTFETHYVPARNEQGEVMGIIGTSTDVTDRVRVEQALRDAEAHYRLLLDNVKDYTIITLDPHGNVKSWNAGAQANNGYTADEILGQHFSCFYPPEAIAQNVPGMILAKAAAEGRTEDEGWRIRKDGSRYWASSTVAAQRSEDGQLIGFSKVVRDFTRRRESEQALHRQKAFVELLQDVAEAANEAAGIEEAMQYALDRICNYTGWKVGHAYILSGGSQESELASLNLWRLDDPQRFEHFRRASENIQFASGQGLPGMVLASGEPVWIPDVTQNPKILRISQALESHLKLGVAFPILVGMNVSGVLEFFDDREMEPDEQFIEVMAHIGTQLGRVVERKHGEDALRQSETRFRTIFEGAPLGIELVDLEGHLLEYNPAVRDMLGYDTDDEINLAGQDRTNDLANLVTSVPALFKELKTGQRDFYRIERLFLRKDGCSIWGRLSVSIVQDEGGQPRYIVGMLEDISESKQMESDLAEMRHRLMEGREAERLHLSQELHDGPVQDLYGLTYQLKAFSQDLPTEVDLLATKEMQEALQQVIHTLRSICGELRPPTLAPFGLEKAIRSHAEEFQEANPSLNVHLDLMPDGQALPEQVRMAMFRIYQQALTNIVRHAQAQHVQVHFSFDEEQVILEVQDDGVGVELPSRWIDLARQGHLGLVGASERAEAVGGQLEVHSKPGKGMALRVSVPRNAGLKTSTLNRKNHGTG